MVKIYYNDRLLALSDKWDICETDHNAIIYKVTKKSDITGMVHYFLKNAQVATLVLQSDDLHLLFDDVKQEFQYLKAAGGLVRNASGDVLMIFRNNRWDLPKGRCEIGEEVEETAVREVEEECGISGLHIQHPITVTYHIYRESDHLVLKRTDWYAMHTDSTATPVPQTIEGIERAEWMAPDRLNTLLSGSYKTIAQVVYEEGLC